MTGFGRGKGDYNDGQVVVEMRAVNHKHLDIKSRHHGVPKAIEDKIRGLLKKSCHRGSFSFNLKVEGVTSSTSVSVNKANLKSLLKELKELESDKEIDTTFDANFLLNHPSVIEKIDLSEDDPELEKAFLEAGRGALEQLVEMRTVEGDKLQKDISERLRHVSDLRKKIENLGGETLATFEKRMTDRLSKLKAEVEFKLDEQRLAQEIALMADKLDVSEELVRLDAHIEHFNNCLLYTSPSPRDATLSRMPSSA